jgi:hypothetical protein
MPAQEFEFQIPIELPQFELVPASPLVLPSPVDSNSPAVWQSLGGVNRLTVVMSWENPSISNGFSLRGLTAAWPVRYFNQSNGGRWMEAVLVAPNGTLYGYYHNEPWGLCPGKNTTAPRIGATRSLDQGMTWEDLGIILEVPVTSLQCSTPNQYFTGGVGDFSVVLDETETEAYFFFTIYSGDSSRQGVAVGKMFWAQRDYPQGNVALWDGVGWRYAPGIRPTQIRRFFQPAPIYAASASWHDDTAPVDSFWGPSIHWNTYLNQYVMLLNRAADSSWTQEGVYISFSPVLHDPAQWTTPVKLVDGGAWYPQVIGLEKGLGTDKLAGAVSRFFMRGQSDYYLVFRKAKDYPRVIPGASSIVR